VAEFVGAMTRKPVTFTFSLTSDTGESPVCVSEEHSECQQANCSCSCHVTFKEDTLRSLDDLIQNLASTFPDDDDLGGPPVLTALRYVSSAVQFYCNVPINQEDAQALVRAERNLSQIICQGRMDDSAQIGDIEGENSV
jgi:hypothetical protein